MSRARRVAVRSLVSRVGLAVDDDPHTAWDLETEGIGEWIRMHVTPMEGATHVRLRIRNGYQKSDQLFEANSRAQTLTAVLLPSKTTVDVSLADRSGWQEVAVDQPAGPLNAIELHVKAVYPGKKYDDLCLSDVQMYVTATSTDNPAYEKQHFQKLLTWESERAAAARLFRTEMGKTLPVAAQYTVSESAPIDTPNAPASRLREICQQDPACAIEANLMRARELLISAVQPGVKPTASAAAHTAALDQGLALAHAKFATLTPVRISAEDKRPVPRVDGLCTPSLNSCDADPCQQALPLPIPKQTGYLRADGIALIEQSSLPVYADASGYGIPQCHVHSGATISWALRDPAPNGAGRVRAVLLVICGLAEGREGSYVAGRTQLLVYGDSGQLDVVADNDRVALLDWAPSNEGPKLAHASVTNVFGGGILTVNAAAPLALK